MTSTFETLLAWWGRQPEREIIVINMVGTKIDACLIIMRGLLILSGESTRESFELNY